MVNRLPVSCFCTESCRLLPLLVFCAPRHVAFHLLESGEDDDDDADGFEDVPATTSCVPPKRQSLQASRDDNEEERLLSRPVALLTDRLPWEVEGNPTSSLSKHAVSRRGRRGGGGGGRARALESIHERPVESIILPDRAERRRKAEESSHRFWKPFDSADFERPEPDYIEAAISMSLAPRSPVAGPSQPSIACRFYCIVLNGRYVTANLGPIC